MSILEVLQQFSLSPNTIQVHNIFNNVHLKAVNLIRIIRYIPVHRCFKEIRTVMLLDSAVFEIFIVCIYIESVQNFESLIYYSPGRVEYRCHFKIYLSKIPFWKKQALKCKCCECSKCIKISRFQFLTNSLRQSISEFIE